MSTPSALGLVGREPARRSDPGGEPVVHRGKRRRESVGHRAGFVGTQRVQVGEPHLVREHDPRTSPQLRERAGVVLAVPEAVHDAVVAAACAFVLDEMSQREHLDTVGRARRSELRIHALATVGEHVHVAVLTQRLEQPVAVVGHAARAPAAAGVTNATQRAGGGPRGRGRASSRSYARGDLVGDRVPVRHAVAVPGRRAPRASHRRSAPARSRAAIAASSAGSNRASGTSSSATDEVSEPIVARAARERFGDRQPVALVQRREHEEIGRLVQQVAAPRRARTREAAGAPRCRPPRARCTM